MIGFLYLVLALLCQDPTKSMQTQTSSSTEVSTAAEDDSTGDIGHLPPPPPPPPIKSE